MNRGRDYTLRQQVLMALGVGVLAPHAHALAQQPVDPGLTDMATGAAPQRQLAAIAALTRVPLAFEQNRGQFSAGTDFVANGPGFNLLLGATGTRLGLRPEGLPGATHVPAWLVVRLVGASADAHAHPQVELPSRSHYYIGSDQSAWVRDVPHYSRVEYRGVYRGIDVVYYGRNGELEYDFVVHPGSDPGDIRIRIEGTRATEITESGDLRLHTAEGSLIHRRPVAYQTIDGQVHAVNARFELEDDDGAPLVRLAVGDHDPGHALVIDPVLAYSSFLGASGNELFSSVAVDREGNVYAAGTLSPTSSTFGDTTAFVTKLAPAASPTVQFTAYLGGSGTDTVNALAIGASGDVYITGMTNSVNLPTCVAGSDCARFGGFNDAYVAKFSPSGTLTYSRFLGGSGSESGTAIVADAFGNFFVAGDTGSANFPAVAAHQPFFGGGQSDFFLTKFNAAGSIVYSTYLGASGVDGANALALGASGDDVYLAGYTDRFSLALGASGGAQPAFGGGQFDGYVAHFSRSGSLLSATRLGGSGNDFIEAIAMGPAGLAVAGSTTSTNFPLLSPVQRTLAGFQDAFVTWLSPSLGSIQRSTYLGSSGSDAAYALVFQPDGDLWVAGAVGASGFPEVAAFAPRPPVTGPSDAFITHFSAAGTIVNSSYLGGSGTDAAFGLALDRQGGVLVSGHTNSPDFALVNSFQQIKGNGYDGFLARIAQPIRLSNLSTRGSVQTGDNVMIGGFVLQGSSSKKVLIKAKGPSLTAFGVAGAMADPSIRLYSGQVEIASNDNWGTNANAAEIRATNLAPTDPQESAILRSLPPGAYTAVVSGVGGSTGVGMVEVFEIDNPEVALANLSTRGPVQTGDSVMIGGFVIEGTAPKTVLITARGPSLSAFGISGALANPALQLYRGQTVIANNDDWGTAPNAAAIQATGLAPTSAQESAILVTLNPGAYTVILSGADGGTGVGIIEVFAR